jgi:hypothetical protein
MSRSRSSWNRAIGFAAIVTLVVSLWVPRLVRAQVAGATLSGTVSDASGSAVPGASIAVKNTETGVSRDVTTDAAGFYNVPNLSPGSYEVTVTAQGFSKLVHSGITLTVGAQQALNLGLQVGQVSQTVEVTAEAPQVELTSSAITAQVNSTTIVDLPLNGRDWSSLAVLQPGTLSIRTQASTNGSANRANRGFGNQLAIGGHRPTENNYRINGMSINDYSNGSPGSVLGAQLGVDAIQEFTVLTTNYTAEYGRTSGGVINAITKPGTNSFHGDAYWFIREKGLNTKSFFSPTIAPFHRNQFGGSAGGPIQKNKTFIFGDFEGIRQDLGLNASNLIVPSAAARQGTLCSTIAANAKCPDDGIFGPHQVQTLSVASPDPATGISQLTKPFLALWPLPNNGLTPTGNGDTGFFLSSPLQTYSENYVTTRVDHTFSDKDSLDGVFFYDKSPQINPDPFLQSTFEAFSERVMGGLEETHIFRPELVNTFRVGYSRSVGFSGVPVGALQPIATDTTLGIEPGHPGPRINITGLAAAQGTIGSQASLEFVQNSFQYYDDAFYTRGAHALKFGFAAERLQSFRISPIVGNGTGSFGSLTAFLQDVPTSVSVSSTTALPIPVPGRQTIFGMYIQDDWRARPNLTINLGLRYEPSTLPSEAGGAVSTVLTTPFGGLPSAQPHLWQTNQTLRNLEPRVGVAWDPFHDGKSSVRAGFGIFDVQPGPWVWVTPAGLTPPFSVPSASAGGLKAGDFPSKFLSSLNNSIPTSSQTFYAPEQNPKRNYTMNWNLSIQHQITSTLTATVAYVGSRTLHSTFFTDDSNMVAPTNVPGLGDIWPCGAPILSNGQCTAITGTKIDPNVGPIRPTFWAVSGKYNALLAQATKRMSHGVQVQASYTWSKCYDNSSSGDIGDQYTNSLSSLIFFEALKTEYPCDYDTRQNFVGNWIWDVPSPKSSAILNRVAGGWQLGGIVTASTGSPFTILMGGDPLGEKNTDPFDFASQISGCNPVKANYRSTLQYLNLSCFTPPVAPAQFASQCANFSGAASPPPAGMVYCANLFGTAGRNSVYGPGLVNVDFSVFKNNYIPRISESFNAQFRAEFFNILNHTNFQSPITTNSLFSASGAPTGTGTLTTVVTDPREIQFSLKLIW